MADDKILVSQLYEKDLQDQIHGPVDLGVTFGNVIDESSKYSLAQFFRSYLDFMRTTTFVHTGSVAPTNNHIGLWIDTSENNKDEIGWTEDTDKDLYFERIIDVFNSLSDDFTYTLDDGSSGDFNRVINLFLDNNDNVLFTYNDGADSGLDHVTEIHLDNSGDLIYSYNDGK